MNKKGEGTGVTRAEIRAYAEEIRHALTEKIVYPVSICDKQRLNGQLLTAVHIQDGCRAVLNYYVEGFYEGGFSAESAAERILSDYNSPKRIRERDRVMSTAMRVEDWEQMKNRLIPILFWKEKNPGIDAVTMELTSRYGVMFRLDVFGDCSSTSIVTPRLLERWGISKQEFLDAGKKAISDMTCVIENMDDFLMETMWALGVSRELFTLSAPCDGDFPAYRVSTRRGHYGASAILNERFQKEILEKTGGDALVIPLNIHEVGVVPAGVVCPENVSKLVWVANTIFKQPEMELGEEAFLLSKELGLILP